MDSGAGMRLVRSATILPLILLQMPVLNLCADDVHPVSRSFQVSGCRPSRVFNRGEQPEIGMASRFTYCTGYALARKVYNGA